MYVIFDADGSTPRASLTASTNPNESSFAIEKELYLEIMRNPFVLREFVMIKADGKVSVERVTNIARSNQTMEPMAQGSDGDIILLIEWGGMRMEYGPRVRKASTHEFLFCVGSVLNPLCDPVKLSHGTTRQIEYILTEEQLPFRVELFKKASVFVARPHLNFRYTYHLDF